jgi:coiled-coil and C2 domain-containing protein 2A
LDLWCTTKQFWEIGAGDEEEHATLVYNYLYYLSVASGENKAALAEKDHHKGRKQQQSDYPSEEAVRGECVFLVLGRAIPEGDTVYILLRDARRKGVAGSPENFLVINPCSGYVYSALDPNCPLREIHCLATPYNVWGNIQTACRPSEMRYDVLDIDQWRPFFGQRLKPPVGSLLHSLCVFVVCSPLVC